jgi:hypothetical protein
VRPLVSHMLGSHGKMNSDKAAALLGFQGGGLSPQSKAEWVLKECMEEEEEEEKEKEDESERVSGNTAEEEERNARQHGASTSGTNNTTAPAPVSASPSTPSVSARKQRAKGSTSSGRNFTIPSLEIPSALPEALKTTWKDFCGTPEASASGSSSAAAPPPAAFVNPPPPLRTSPPTHVHVVVMWCRGLRGADFTGYSDPFVEVGACGASKSHRHRTAVVNQTLNPAWDSLEERLLIPCTAGDGGGGVVFSVFDKDMGRSSDFLGGAVVSVADVPRW